MNNFKIVCDKNAKSFGSTDIIVRELNTAAKNIGLYDDKGKLVMYDTLCQSYGENPDAFFCAFELPFANYLLNNANGKPIIGLSKENAVFAAHAGYKNNLLNYSSLGVNRKHWPLTEKKYMKDKFVFLSMCESNTRSGFDILVPAFCEQFKDNKNVVLYIKDRESTDIFKNWVKEYSSNYNVEIIHDDRHIENYEEQVKIYETADAAICLNRSHTFGLVLIQGMSCGLPTICQRYSGFTDYTMHTTNLCVDFDVVNLTQFDLEYLMSIGMKNHLFPINTQNYPIQPFWSQPRKEDVKIKMQQMVDDKNLRNILTKMSDLIASWFTWERTAVNMSYILDGFDKNLCINGL